MDGNPRKRQKVEHEASISGLEKEGGLPDFITASTVDLHQSRDERYQRITDLNTGEDPELEMLQQVLLEVNAAKQEIEDSARSILTSKSGTSSSRAEQNLAKGIFSGCDRLESVHHIILKTFQKKTFPILWLPYPVLRRLLGFLTMQEKGYLRSVSSRFAEIIISIDPSMRTWTPEYEDKLVTVAQVLNRAKLKGITDLPNFNVDVGSAITHRRIDLQVRAFLALWGDYCWRIDLYHPRRFLSSIPHLKYLQMHQCTTLSVNEALNKHKQSLKRVQLSYLSDNADLELDCIASNLQEISLLNHTALNHLPPLLKFAKNVKFLEFYNQKSLYASEYSFNFCQPAFFFPNLTRLELGDFKDAAATVDLLTTYANKLKSVSICVGRPLEIELSHQVLAPNLESLSVQVTSDYLKPIIISLGPRLLKYGQKITTLKILDLYLPELDTNQYSFPNLKHLNFDCNSAWALVKMAADTLETLCFTKTINVPMTDDCIEFPEKLTQLKTLMINDDSTGYFADLFLEGAYPSCVDTLRHLIIRRHWNTQNDPLSLLRFPCLTDLYFDNVSLTWVSSMLDLNESLKYVSVLVKDENSLDDFKFSSTNVKEIVLRIEVSHETTLEKLGGRENMMTACRARPDFVRLRSRYPGVIFSVVVEDYSFRKSNFMTFWKLQIGKLLEETFYHV